MRNRKGRIIKGGDLCSNDKTGNKDMVDMARIAPDRRWFGNTRVVGQRQLDTFRAQIKEKSNDPYAMIIRSKSLPMALLEDPRTKGKSINGVFNASTFSSTFGPKKTRKRPKLASRPWLSEAKVKRARKTSAGAEGRHAAEEASSGARIDREDIFANRSDWPSFTKFSTAATSSQG